MKKTVSQVKKTTSLITGTFDSAAGLLHHEMRTNDLIADRFHRIVQLIGRIMLLPGHAMRTNDLVTHTFRQIACTNGHITGTNGCITGFIYFYTTGFI
jgi:hypothetical protein